MVTVPAPKRGEIWLIDFDPAMGAEMRKIRPAVVINVDEIGRLPLRIVVPITDWNPQYAHYPWFVKLPASPTNGLVKDSAADAFQTKSISQARFVHLLGKVNAAQVDDITSAIALCIGVH